MVKKVLCLAVLTALSFQSGWAQEIGSSKGYLRQSDSMKRFLEPATAAGSPQEIAKRAQKSVGMIELSGGGGATGFFLAPSVFVTNHHVAAAGFPLGSVVKVNGFRYRYGKVLADDPNNDIALIEMRQEGFANKVLLDMGKDPVTQIPLAETYSVEGSKSNVPPLPLAIGDLAVGDTVYLYGNPHGMNATFSTGMVSAFRNKNDMHELCSYADADIIQYTAPTSAGSSGSPVLNSKGEVVGVHFAAVNAPEGEKVENMNMARSAKHLRALLKKAGVYDLVQQGSSPAEVASTSKAVQVPQRPKKVGQSLGESDMLGRPFVDLGANVGRQVRSWMGNKPAGSATKSN